MKPLHLLLLVLVAGILGGGASDLSGFFRSVGNTANEARAEMSGASSTATHASCQRQDQPVVIRLRSSAFPNVTAHINRARRDGYPRTLTLRRDLARTNWNRVVGSRRAEAGLDLWPIAASREANHRVDVERVPAAENRRSGRKISAALSPFCNGQRFQVKTS